MRLGEQAACLPHVCARPMRRSTRAIDKTYNIGERKKGGLLPSLTKQWRQQYIDMGHCRLKRCRERLQQATAAELCELQTGAPDFSFTAMAIAATSAYGNAKEHELLAYVRCVIARGLNPNDRHLKNPSVVLAAYHGFTSVLIALLNEGCAIHGDGEYGHAVMGAVRNGQHDSLQLVLQQPTAAALLANNSCAPRASSSVLFLAIERRDGTSLRMLRDSGLRLSDYDFVCLALKRYERSRFEPMLRAMHAGTSVLRWSPALHWSFPTTDRETLSLLWHTMRHWGRLPEELWLQIFASCERGWWSTRQLYQPTTARLLERGSGSALEWNSQLV